MFIVIASIAILVPAAFGAYLLFTPMEKLIAGVAWMRLPMPKEGSSAHAVLRYFWRGIGVVALGFALFVFYMLFIRKP